MNHRFSQAGQRCGQVAHGNDTFWVGSFSKPLFPTCATGMGERQGHCQLHNLRGQTHTLGPPSCAVGQYLSQCSVGQHPPSSTRASDLDTGRDSWAGMAAADQLVPGCCWPLRTPEARASRSRPVRTCRPSLLPSWKLLSARPPPRSEWLVERWPHSSPGQYKVCFLSRFATPSQLLSSGLAPREELVAMVTLLLPKPPLHSCNRCRDTKHGLELGPGASPGGYHHLAWAWGWEKRLLA